MVPKPPTCGGKKRAEALASTVKAVRPWKLGKLMRADGPPILELCQAIGKKIGVLPKTLKS